ncbi:MAG: BrnT family toxin [Treponema sp.]|nr:BrnT family toxin [Treponema sp.]
MGLFHDVLFVVYTERGNATRIISARVAEPFERRIYGSGTVLSGGWQRVNP